MLLVSQEKKKSSTNVSASFRLRQHKEVVLAALDCVLRPIPNTCAMNRVIFHVESCVCAIGEDIMRATCAVCVVSLQQDPDSLGHQSEPIQGLPRDH